MDAGREQLFECANNELLFPLQLNGTEPTTHVPADDTALQQLLLIGRPPAVFIKTLKLENDSNKIPL